MSNPETAKHLSPKCPECGGMRPGWPYVGIKCQRFPRCLQAELVEQMS